jgi:hypothetical protein
VTLDTVVQQVRSNLRILPRTVHAFHGTNFLEKVISVVNVLLYSSPINISVPLDPYSEALDSIIVAEILYNAPLSRAKQSYRQVLSFIPWVFSIHL